VGKEKSESWREIEGERWELKVVSNAKMDITHGVELNSSVSALKDLKPETTLPQNAKPCCQIVELR
jgi:hypothetical protein